MALGDSNGAVVVMDPRNGEILALVSHPSYDPNDFAVRINRTDWNKLITDPDHPLMNKAIQDQLAPGSTFKIIMSAAGLQEGVAQNMHVNCAGGGDFYGRFFNCDKHHGALDIEQAIPLSCDTFFYTLAQTAGHRHDREVRHLLRAVAEDRHRSAQRNGGHHAVDAVGDEELSPEVLRGQHDLGGHRPGRDAGDAHSAPARAVSGIASDGHFVRPHVVAPGELPADFRQAVLDSLPGSGDKTVPLNPDTWMTITDGMAAATTPGTAAAARIWKASTSPARPAPRRWWAAATRT